MGSDSPRSREEARDRLIRCGGTLTTASPSASRSRSSREVTARQYSTPQTRSVPNLLRAHCTPSPCAALVVAMVFWPSLPPVLLTATRVWVFLWASTPITTSIADYSKEDWPEERRGSGALQGLLLFCGHEPRSSSHPVLATSMQANPKAACL